MKRMIMITSAVLTCAGCGGGGDAGNQEMTVNEVAKQMSAVRIEAGLWETTTEVTSASAPGMPPEALKQMTGRQTTGSNCVTPEQAARPDANFLTAQENNACRYQGFSMENGRIQGTMTCGAEGAPGEMRMTMDGEYGARSYDMRMEMVTSGMPGGQSMTMEARTTGRRVGECPAEGAAQ